MGKRSWWFSGKEALEDGACPFEQTTISILFVLQTQKAVERRTLDLLKRVTPRETCPDHSMFYVASFPKYESALTILGSIQASLQATFCPIKRQCLVFMLLSRFSLFHPVPKRLLHQTIGLDIPFLASKSWDLEHMRSLARAICP